ncbi:MAG: sensory transduction histidine kinase [Eubacterium sp.]|nr:sensory transduction histidine kinase [Eubacterium sp.]
MNRIYKVNIVTALLMAVLLLVSLLSSIYLYVETDNKIYDNDIRMLVSEQKKNIDKGVYSKGKYVYIVFGLDGKVKYSEAPFAAKPGEIVNVQEMLQTDKSFRYGNKSDLKENFVIQKDGKTIGFAVFLVPEADVVKDTSLSRAFKAFLPLIAGILLCIIILTLRTIYCNTRIIKPLKEISGSAKGIIAGNYDLEVVRTYSSTIGDNEVGELTYSFELMRDELKQKQLREEELKKSQQELISCISHDLKTPISTIKAYSEGIRDGLARTPKLQEEYVNIIINKTNLLTDMINELLVFSNAQLNQLEINRQEIYFLEYFKGVINELELFVKQSGMQFSHDIKTPDMIVNIDTRRITEVLYNIVENSIKYIGEKKGIIVIEAEREGTSVLIKVKDNGIGISPDDIPHVFDKFYRAEKSRSSSIPGSGLGLSICKYIIDVHEGEIYCKSRHNQGCEIGFTLK